MYVHAEVSDIAQGIGSQSIYLEHHGAFEYDQHEQSEEAVVPILVKAPQGNAEDLKDKERRRGVLAKKGGKRRYWYVEFIFPIQICQGLNFVRCEAFG